MKPRTYLRSGRKRSVDSQVPDRAILDMGQIAGDFHIGDTSRLGNPTGDLDPLVEVDGVPVTDGVVVQPHAVLVTGVLVQRIGAVRCGLAVESQVDCLASSHGRVIGNALVDVHAGVITLAPCYS